MARLSLPPLGTITTYHVQVIMCIGILNVQDPELVAHRRRAHDINRRFNDTPSDAVAQRREIINEYFHPDCKDRPSIYIGRWLSMI